jgi:hypothetical protein
MGEAQFRSCDQCSKHLVTQRKGARFCGEECKNAWHNKQRLTGPTTDKRLAPASGTEESLNADVHELQQVREEQARKKHNRDLGGIIRQAIVNRLRTHRECTADDLIELYPEGEVDLCRRLATAQFGSLAAGGDGRQPLIREKGESNPRSPRGRGPRSRSGSSRKQGGTDTGPPESPPTNRERPGFMARDTLRSAAIRARTDRASKTRKGSRRLRTAPSTGPVTLRLPGPPSMQLLLPIQAPGSNLLVLPAPRSLPPGCSLMTRSRGRCRRSGMRRQREHRSG